MKLLLGFSYLLNKHNAPGMYIEYTGGSFEPCPIKCLL